jgi:glycosyltransferase involved in cell wall biosynthesis
MKIIVATESYWPNLDGGSVFERNLVLGLGKLGHEVRVIAPSLDGKPTVQRDGRSEIHRVRSIHIPEKFGAHGARSSFFPGKAIRDLVEGFQPDVIHGHNNFAIGVNAQKAAIANNVPYVATYHNMPENAVDNMGVLRYLIPNLVGRIWKRDISFLNRANYVTSPTKTAIDYLVSHGLAVPHEPVSNGVDLEKYRPGPAPAALRKKFRLPKKPILLYTGRLDGEKRLDVWMEAAAMIRKEMDVHFLLVGRGSGLGPLKRQAAQLGIAQHTTFTGPVSDDDLVGLYKCGTVFAISSPAELQSLVTLEAMATALPVVAVDAMALPELCHSGKNGYLFQNGDAKGMAQAVLRILQKPGMGKQMGAESRTIVEDKHDVRQMPKNYLKIYERVQRKA